MKKVSVLALVAAMAVAVTACGGSSTATTTAAAAAGSTQAAAQAAAPAAAAEDPIVFVCAHTNTEENVNHIGLLEFEKFVEEKTNGKVDVQIYPNGQLGGERELVEGVELGSVQLVTVSASIMSFHDDKFNLLELPFLFNSYEAAWNAYDGELGKIYSDYMKEYNLLSKGFFCGGFRAISNNVRPIHTPDDMKGLKIRSMESDMFMTLFKLLGANPTPMSFNEIYTALEQGTIDGQDNPANITYTSKFYEKLKYMTATNHVALAGAIIVDNNFYESLDDETKAVIDEGLADYLTYIREAKREEEQKAIEVIKESGTEYVTLSDDEMKLFREAVAPIHDQYRDIVGSDVIDIALSY